MMKTKNIVIEKATVENAEEVLELQKMAYLSEAELIDDYTIQPLKQTMDEILSEFKHQNIFKVEFDGRIIGSVRTYVKSGTCYIGKLIVHPDYQGKGIGTKLLLEAEKQVSDVERYELFTGQKSQMNLHFYGKNGYAVFHKKKISEKLTLVFMEKINADE